MKKALVLIDFQNDYFEGGKMEVVNSEKAALKAKNILKYFREKKLPIIHIQHISTREGATSFIPNTEGVKINKNVKPLANEKIIIKHVPNSFRDTDLLDFLNINNVTDLVICGMMTHMCVDATTRAAKDFGLNIQLIGDACATRDLEINSVTIKAKDVHNSFLSALNYYYSEVLTTDQFLSK